jgi:hypothetical protein
MGWSLFLGFSSKININFRLMGFRLFVVDRWSIFRGGRKHRFNCISNMFGAVIAFVKLKQVLNSSSCFELREAVKLVLSYYNMI